MFYYLYEIKNKINGKIYVGVHRTKNMDDGYMGSGKILKHAIAKYGIENFQKTILEIFDNAEDMFSRELQLVDEDFVSRNDTYNMRRGGTGGFDHINKGPVMDRINIKSLLAKYASGELTPTGSERWSIEGRQKVIESARRNSKMASELAKSPEAKEKSRQTRIKNKSSQGENNSQYGTHLYIDASYIGKLPGMEILGKQRYIEGNQPTNWIRLSEWRNRQKKKNNSLGRHWYNDGVSNFYLYPNDEKVLNLERGRLGKLFKEKVSSPKQ